MKNLVVLSQIFFAFLLMTVILIQAKGTGLGSAWGRSGEFYHSKRGVEKILFLATIVLAVIFLLLSIVNTFI
jgi:protein translocase SecG subunit